MKTMTLANSDLTDSLKRNMASRHLSMIAIGGSIGTGLFLAMGNSIHAAGPGGTVIAYLIIGIMVYFLMMSLGEMAAFMPTSGSFYSYSAEFIDPALGYAMGFNYWYSWAITVACEIVAASLIMGYWFPHVPAFYWNLTFFLAFFGINVMSARGFGETEYWFSFIKVTAIVLFIILGGALISGLMGHHPTSYQYWTIGDGPFHGGWLAILNVCMITGFSFQGTELVGVAAGESKNPHVSIPKAIKKVFWRILLFYVISIIVVSFLIPYTSTLLTSDDVRMSPFTLVFHQAGIASAASLMNLVIIVAILSAGNSGMYAATRMLWHLAKQKHMPAIFARVNKRGVPIYALLVTASVSGLAFLSSLFGKGIVYLWLVNASSLCGFITWTGIAASHYRFRKAYIKQGGNIKDLPYLAKGYPYAPLAAFILCLIVIAGQNYSAFTGSKIDFYGIFVSYASLPAFLVCWFGYKWIKKTKMVNLNDCNFNKLRQN
jgi:lysine-specific permease